MRMWVWAIFAAATGFWAGEVRAQGALDAFDLSPATPAPSELSARGPVSVDVATSPFWLAVVSEPPSVYPEIIPPRDEEGTNSGSVRFGLNVDWLTDYIYRGVDQSTPGYRPETALQFNIRADFDTGKFPHPFIGLFVNVFNSDPISRFEEVRPNFGLEWTVQPLILAGGFNSYIFPNRKNIDTQEVFASVTFDDSRLFHTPQPMLSPYVYGAYDFSLYNGFYAQAGLKHDFIFEDYGFTLTPATSVAYVFNNPHYGLALGKRDYGLQHYEVDFTGNYSLNHALHLNRRFGEWSINGYLDYTGRLDTHLRADTLIWGGVGLEFRY